MLDKEKAIFLGSRRKIELGCFFIAVAISCLILSSSLGIIISSSPMNTSVIAPGSQPAHVLSSVTPTNFTYQNYTGTFAAPDSPTYAGATVGPITTDWGKISLGSGANTLTNVTWGAQAIPNGWYDTYMNYWYYNASGQAGRPFSTDWGGWYEIRNDSYMAVYQRSAQSPSIWSGVDEWNVTIRVGILKHDPYVRLDGFIRFVNPTSLIKYFDCSPIYYWLGGYGGLTRAIDTNRMLSYITADSGAYAVAQLGGPLIALDLSVGAPIGSNLANRTHNRMTENFHFASILIVGQNLSDLQTKADNLGSMWNRHEEKADYNLVVAKNGAKFDAFDYFSASGYKITPSGTSETIIAQNASTTVNHFVNPLLNYARIPVITDADDHQFAEGDNPTWDWLYATARKYSMAITFPSYFANTIGQNEINSYISLSNERNGTLFEIADHGYNHTSFYDNQAYPYAGATYNLSKAKWSGNTSIPLVSESLPANQYSYNTWDSLGAAGVKNLRLDQAPAGWVPPMDYNLTGSPIWVKMFQVITVSSTPGAATLTNMISNGYYYHQGHVMDFDTGGEQTSVALWFSWVQNTSGVISVTHSQFSDLWHHRIVVSDVDGTRQINLIGCQSNHLLRLNATPGNFWYDVTDGSLMSFRIDGSELLMFAERGHVYRELPIQVSTTGYAVVNLLSYSPTSAIIASWSTDGSAGSTVTFALSGLVSGTTYKVYVDGVIAATMVAAGGQITFDYSAWSTHTFDVVAPETYTAPDDTLVVDRDMSPATSDPGETSLTWTSPALIVIVSGSLLLALVLLLRKPRQGTRTARR